jgi:hypothetical protein
MWASTKRPYQSAASSAGALERQWSLVRRRDGVPVRPRQTRTTVELAQGCGSPRAARVVRFQRAFLGYHQEVALQSAVQPLPPAPPLASLSSPLLSTSPSPDRTVCPAFARPLLLLLPPRTSCTPRTDDTHAATPAAAHWPKCPSRIAQAVVAARVRVCAQKAPLCLPSLVLTPAFWPTFANHRCSFCCMPIPSPSNTTYRSNRPRRRAPYQTRLRTLVAYLLVAHRSSRRHLLSASDSCICIALLQWERAGLPSLSSTTPVAHLFATRDPPRRRYRDVSQLFDSQAAYRPVPRPTLSAPASSAEQTATASLLR